MDESTTDCLASRSPARMSDSSDDDDQREAEPASRTWAESQPGPSRCPPSRQGYCGYCRILYSNLDQHLSSLRHLDSVRSSSRGSSATSSSSSRTKLTLLERFLQDVLQHHPHRYNDPRPSHADLPSVSAPLLPRAELDEVDISDDDSRSRGTREHLPSSDDASCQPANQQEADGAHSQSGETASQERLSAPVREQEGGGHSPHTQPQPPHSQTPPPLYQTPPPVHRKAHRKTNRRKTSNSSSSSQPPRGPGPGSQPHQNMTPGPSPGLRPGSGLCMALRLQAPTELIPSPSPGLRPGPWPQTSTDLRPSTPGELRPQTSTDLRPWRSWQKERRAAHREEAFSSDHSDLLDQTIEEVIQMCCHGDSPPPCQQEETDSFHLSLPVSMETQSEDWDSPVQVASQQGRRDAPVQTTEGQDLSCLMDTQVDLEDQVYSYQLDSALLGEHRPAQDQGFWTLPIEEVLPAPKHIPESFMGKTWDQIEKEDEERVDRLVRQFRRGRFVCYFDSESLARFGRRSQKKKGHGETERVEPDEGILPLLDQEDKDSAYIRPRKRRGFRLASRCQVVKVSHSTQTIQLVVPAVHHLALEAPPTSVPVVNQEAAERTPEAQTWRCLPPSYSTIVTPVQPCTSLVYLLSSPTGPAPTCTLAVGSAPKRCRKKKRPLDLQGLKVKYKRLPVRFYEPGTNRILKTPPKGFLWCRGPAPSGTPPSCVRQLFRSLSPDLNTDRPPMGDGAAGSSRVKGHRSSDPPFSHGSSFLLSTLSRDSAQTHLVRRRARTSQVTPPPLNSRSEQGRGGRRDRTRPPPKRRTRAQATPPQPRREGLRPSHLTPTPPNPPSSRRGRGRRGRGYDKGRR